MVCFRDDLLTRSLQRAGGHQRAEIALLRSLLRPGDRVLDVGAHLGATAIPLAQRVGALGKVHAFEGDERVRSLLEVNIRLNGLEDVVEIVPAVAADGGTFRPRPHLGNSGATHFEPTEGSSEDSVSSIRIDDWWEEARASQPKDARVALIKADVEGMEVSVLESGLHLIERDRPLLHLEVVPPFLRRAGTSTKRLESLLTDLGYLLYCTLDARDSRKDTFRLARLRGLHDGGEHFDVLAVHSRSSSQLRPLPQIVTQPWLMARRIRQKLRRAIRVNEDG